MRVFAAFVVISLIWSPAPVWASDINLVKCEAEPSSEACLDYLAGIVDGALAVAAVMEKKPELPTSSLTERALKYRSGSRFKTANDAFCQQRRPERDQLVLALGELAAKGELRTQQDLQQALLALSQCQGGR